MTSTSDTLRQIAEQQLALQTQITALVEAMNTNATRTTGSKSSTAKPEPFKGKASDVRRFLSFFKNWAASQTDMNSYQKSISAALSFMQEDAADWAARYADQAVQSGKENSTVAFPFNANWDEFEKQFKIRFGALDEEAEARAEIRGIRQGKSTVAQYAQKFQDLGSRTGFSDADLRERFYAGLNANIRLHLVSIDLGQGKAKTLEEAVTRACTVDTALHDPSLHLPSQKHYNSTTTDPNAMDIDATRMGNGNTRESFLQKMRGRCFGCGSADHIKGACNWKNESCRYCTRQGHVERVCQDKFMGLERNRGSRQRRGPPQKVAATSEPFSLFPSEAVNASSNPNPTAPPPIPSATTSTDLSAQLAAMKEAVTQQNAVLAAFMSKQKDF
jgi:Retrotransposon gag protein